MALEKKDIEHIATLCNLHLSEVESEKLSEVLTDTLNYINILDELDTKTVVETYQVTGLVNVYRDDTQTRNSLTKEEALSNAKEVVDNKFATKAVFNRDQ
ncbi:MAG: Asp-tRNA(Asn)/Glu-tRNA(Gln) amidotransferase subunit GatC [Patescibacteria group bacterium]|jgi:aspartyl/glutamyl-tRNA(Asn/Gln) amidotransferase C subunit